MDTDFDFKPINEGLGFHRKVKPLDTEAESDESFSFSTLGPGTLAQPAVEANSREQSKGLLSSGPATTDAGTTPAKKKQHNAKSVSDLIAALPPSLDFLLEDQGSAGAPAANSSSTSSPATSGPITAPAASLLGGLGSANTTSSAAVSSAASAAAASLRKSPLFSSPSGLATPGAPAAASMAPQEKTDTKAPKRGFLKMPLGRSDYDMKSENSSGVASVNSLAARAASSLDENVAKTFPTVFPHLGSLAGKPAAAAVKAATKTTGLHAGLATAGDITIEKIEERPLATHFGSAILDTLVAVGLGCVLLAVSLSITNANLLALLENSQTDRETISALALLFVAGGLLYVLAARSFLGATLGEWSYEIRVGDRDARKRWFYPIQVVWRGMLVAATGFIIFPIVSAIAGKDVLKYLTGLGLVSHDGSAADLNARSVE